jgi:hypothetical protein
MRSINVTLEFVPPRMHRANKAERAIRDWKTHLIAMLDTVHITFPLDLWDELLPQADLTLNLLRPYKPKPELSAYAGIFGKPYDFMGHPLAPVGTSVLIHETPQQRSS